MENEIYNLGLHKSIYIREIKATIIRVHNGWVYQFEDSGQRHIVQTTFVPEN